MPKGDRHLILHVDGASRGNPGPSGIGIVIKDARGRIVREIAEYIGQFTNNVAEYRALIRALEEAEVMHAAEIEVRSDSDLLVSQLKGTYKVKSPDLSPLYLDAIRLLRSFAHWTVHKISRGQNAAADALASKAIDHAMPESVVEFSVLVEERNDEFVARVLALPDVKAVGKTQSEALERVRIALLERIKQLQAAGRPIPKEDRIRVRILGPDVE